MEKTERILENRGDGISSIDIKEKEKGFKPPNKFPSLKEVMVIFCLFGKTFKNSYLKISL